MAGIGEALAVAGILEPAFKACFEAYGFYRLTKNFGEDFQKAERLLRGQTARLKLLGDTQIKDLLSAPEDGTQLASVATWTLQDMRKNFDLCEDLMKKHGEPETPRKRLQKVNVAGPQRMADSSPSPSQESGMSFPPSSPVETKSKSLFSRSKRSSPSISSSSRTLSPSTTDTITPALSISPPSTIGSLYDSKITQGVSDDAMKTRALQSSSSLLGRLKWASDDRRQFYSAIEDLTKANDLLEKLLRIRPPEDCTFLASSRDTDDTNTINSIMATRASLEKLHRDLLAANPNGREVEFCLKLALDNRDKEDYADEVDKVFDADSAVYSLQAHLKSAQEDNNKSYYLLAETEIEPEIEVPMLDNLVAAIKAIDSNADPSFQCLGESSVLGRTHPNLRIYQDKTTCWRRTQTLADGLQRQSFRDICFQKHYIQLGLFIAFSYAALPFTFKGKTEFPQVSNYIYYDSILEEIGQFSGDNDGASSIANTTEEENSTRGHDSASNNTPHLALQEKFRELESPYLSFSFGSRPPKKSTKALGKRPGYTAPTNNAVVSLGLLLYQIGSWNPMPANDNITQMRRDALDSSHSLIRLSGVEFADITRACLNWKENGIGGRRSNSEDMLMKIYARLDEYNKELQDLM